MKKQKRSLELEEQEASSSQDLGLVSEDLDEEEIVIELQDVVEYPEDLDDEEGGAENLEVELLDAEPGLDFRELDTKGVEDEDEDLFEHDLLKEFALSEEPVAEKPSPGPEREGPAVEEDFFEKIAREEAESSMEEPELPPGPAPVEAAAPGVDAKSGKAPPEAPPDSSVVSVAAVAAVPVPEVASRELSSSPAENEEINAILDQFLNRIEERVGQMIGEAVEARLPQIVRSLLREEIERIKSQIP
ncbi:MAG TPA: hypothetical protein PLM79_15920 [Syntrophobacteraceae bacterium]|nr:hypothetical protein [Syntrophobacteraceae bacterium]